MKNPVLQEGDQAPEFCLPDSTGQTVCLKDFRGKYVVLYFYPKDKTPGCTMEAKDFTGLKPEFEKKNTVILGVSKDSIRSHQNFIEGKKLKITLLSDEDTTVQQKYGVWRKKKFMGREYTGTVRSTFLIDPKGKIVKIWDGVKVRGHAREVFDVIDSLN